MQIKGQQINQFHIPHASDCVYLWAHPGGGWFDMTAKPIEYSFTPLDHIETDNYRDSSIDLRNLCHRRPNWFPLLSPLTCNAFLSSSLITVMAKLLEESKNSRLHSIGTILTIHSKRFSALTLQGIRMRLPNRGHQNFRVRVLEALLIVFIVLVLLISPSCHVYSQRWYRGGGRKDLRAPFCPYGGFSIQARGILIKFDC